MPIGPQDLLLDRAALVRREVGAAKLPGHVQEPEAHGLDLPLERLDELIVDLLVQIDLHFNRN
jgi:hypothetical protein